MPTASAMLVARLSRQFSSAHGRCLLHSSQARSFCDKEPQGIAAPATYPVVADRATNYEENISKSEALQEGGVQARSSLSSQYPHGRQFPPQRTAAGPLRTGLDPGSREVIESISSEDVESFPRFQRPFVDRIWLDVRAGNGGDPAPHQVRHPDLPKGPGFGGDGGSVFLKASILIESYLDTPQKVKAAHGGNGHDSHRGKHARDFCLQVPLGTIVREREYSGDKTPEGRRAFLPRFKYQFLKEGDTYVVARGGIGGVGPKSFKLADKRRGTPGQRKRLELELRLLNDCSFVGMPNAGKTALLAALSRAHTRIGPEEFSTTRPHVGVIRFRDRLEVRLADLPGLKQGAAADKDMGRRILRHTYRSRALAFVVDVARGDRPETDVLEEVEMLRAEACRFDPLNADKPWMVIGTKCDMLHRDSLFHLDSLHYRLRARYGLDVPVVGTSARFGLGLSRAVRTIRQLVFPDSLELSHRVPGQAVPTMPLVTELPGVLHGRFDGTMPSMRHGTVPLLLPGNFSQNVED